MEKCCQNCKWCYPVHFQSVENFRELMCEAHDYKVNKNDVCSNYEDDLDPGEIYLGELIEE